jgi:DNA gyrase subunit A
VMGMNLKEGDYIEHLHISSTHDYMLFFTNQGRVYRLKVYELPEGSRAAKGRALVNVLPLQEKEKVMAVIPTRDFSEGKYLVFGTADGMVKKTEFKEYDTAIKAAGLVAIKIRKGDELVQARLTSGKDDIIMVSKSGHAVRFKEQQARPMGRGTAGVKGMNVSDKRNRVLSLDVVDPKDKSGELLVVTENGYGKRTLISEYPVKGRGAKGVLTAKLTAKKGGLAGGRVVREGEELLFISQSGMVQRTAVSDVSRMGRPTQGVRVMSLKANDRVSAVALVVESRAADGNGSAPTAAPAEELAAAEAAGDGKAEVKLTKADAEAARAADEKPSGGGKASKKAAKPKRQAGGKAKAGTTKSAATKAAAGSKATPKRAAGKATPARAKPKTRPRTSTKGKASTTPRSKRRPPKGTVRGEQRAAAKKRAAAARAKRSRKR